MTTFSDELLEQVDRGVTQVLSRELEPFIGWVKKRTRSNPLCYLYLNPANHVYEMPDGSYSLRLVDSWEELEAAKTRSGSSQGTWYSHEICFSGRFADALSYLKCQRIGKKREIAIAMYVSYSSNFLCNFPEYQSIAADITSEEGDPFSDKFADRLLDRFKEDGLI